MIYMEPEFNWEIPLLYLEKFHFTFSYGHILPSKVVEKIDAVVGWRPLPSWRWTWMEGGSGRAWALVFLSFFNWLILGHTARYGGSWFPYQRLNPRLLQGKCGVSTTRLPGKSLGFAQEYMFEKGSLNPGNTWLENGIMSRGNQGHEMVQSHSYILRWCFRLDPDVFFKNLKATSAR